MKLTKRQKKALVAATITLVITLVGLFQPSWLGESSQTVQQNQPGLYEVLQVYDGDTILVDMNGTKEEIRFIGVDTPETRDPRKPVQCFGKTASAYTNELIGQNRVRLEADPLNTNRDRYNRLLRYVYLPDGTLVNLKIVQDGYGFAYTFFPVEKAQQFEDAEKAAREANRGLWGTCEVDTGNTGAKSTNPAD